MDLSISENESRQKAQNQIKWMIKKIHKYTSSHPLNLHDGLLPSYPKVWRPDRDIRYKYIISDINYHKLISYYMFIAWEELRRIYMNITSTLHMGGGGGDDDNNDNDDTDAQTVINSLRQLVLIVDPNFDANTRSSIDALTGILSIIFSEYRIDPARDIVWNNRRNIYMFKKTKSVKKREGDIAAAKAVVTANRRLVECQANIAGWKELASTSQVKADNLAAELDAVNSQHALVLQNNEMLNSNAQINQQLVTAFVTGLGAIQGHDQALVLQQQQQPQQLVEQYQNVLRDYTQLRARINDLERLIEMERQQVQQLGQYILDKFSSDLSDMVQNTPTVFDSSSPVQQARFLLDRYSDRYWKIANDSMTILNSVVLLQPQKSFITDPLQIPDAIQTVGTIIRTYAGNLVHMFRMMNFFQKLLALIRAYPELVTRIKIPAFSESAKALANTLRYFYDEKQVDNIINQMHSSEYLNDYFDTLSNLVLPDGDLLPESLESILLPAATDTALVMRQLHAAPLALDAMPTVADEPLVIFRSTIHAHWSLNSYPSTSTATAITTTNTTIANTVLVQRSRAQRKCRYCIGCMTTTKTRTIKHRSSRLTNNNRENKKEEQQQKQQLLKTSTSTAPTTATDWQTKYVQCVERANAIESSLRAELEDINTNRILPLERQVQVLTKQLTASQEQVDKLNNEINKQYWDANEAVEDKERHYRGKYEELVNENKRQSEHTFLLEIELKEAKEAIASEMEDFTFQANESQETIHKLKENIKSLTDDVLDCRKQKTQLESEILAIIESPSEASEIVEKLIKLKRLPHLGKRLRTSKDSM
jgi:hypothetical protein